MSIWGTEQSLNDLQGILESPSPPFSLLEPVDLIPANKVAEFEAILDKADWSLVSFLGSCEWLSLIAGTACTDISLSIILQEMI